MEDYDTRNLPVPPQNYDNLPPRSPIKTDALNPNGNRGMDGSHVSTGSAKSTARTEALYLHAKVRDMKLEDRRQEELEKQTFQPEIATRASIEVSSTFDQRQKEVINRRREKVRELSEQEQIHHTGQPNLGKTAHINERVRSLMQRNQPQSVHQSLHNQSMEHHERKNQYAKKLHRECTFKPTMYTKKSPATKAVKSRSQTPVFDRLHDRHKQRSKSVQSRGQREAQEAEGCTFSPQLITKTYSRPTTPMHARDGTPEGAQGPVHERLYSTAARRKMRLDAMREEKRERSMDDVTFQPRINKTPLRSRERENSSAHDRLYSAAHERRKKVEDKINLANKEYSFKPKLNKSRNQHVQDDTDRLDTLYKIGVAKQSKRGPKTYEKRSVGSALLKADATIYGAAEDVNAQWRNEMEEKELEEECTFQPTLVTKKKSQFSPMPTVECVESRDDVDFEHGNSDNGVPENFGDENFEYNEPNNGVPETFEA